MPAWASGVRLTSSLSLLLLAASFSHALVTFPLNCTAPTNADHVNFVESPTVRSTADILWPCLSILLLCTWNVQHPAVPPHYLKRKPGKLGKIQDDFAKGWEKAKWMFIVTIMPEYMFGKAMTEHFAAHLSRKRFSHPAWTMMHGYFANMRGFVFSFDVAAVPTDLEPSGTGGASVAGLQVTHFSEDPEIPYERQKEEDAIRMERKHCWEICRREGTVPCRNRPGKPEMPLASHVGIGALVSADVAWGVGSPRMKDSIAAASTIRQPLGEMEHHGYSKSAEAGDGEPKISDVASVDQTDDEKLGPHKPWRASWALSADQLYYAYQEGLIKVPTHVTSEVLKDKSKGDSLSKAIALFQITWMVIQIVTRAVENLAITLIEITVLAFAATAIGVYIVIWDKPQNVDVPLVVEAERLVTRKDVIELAARAPKSSMFVHEFWLHGVNCRTMADNIFPYSHGVRFRLPWPGARDHHITPVFVGIGLGGAIFGAVHCAAWNFHFPHPIERLLWRIACIFVMVSPLPAAFYYVYTQHSAKVGKRNETWTHALMLPLYLLMPLYLAARMYLLVEALLALAYPVASSFQTVMWPNSMPHIG